MINSRKLFISKIKWISLVLFCIALFLPLCYKIPILSPHDFPAQISLVKTLLRSILLFLHGIMITLIGYYDIEHLILVFVVQLYYFFKWEKKKIEISDLVVLGIAFLLLLLFNSYDAERGAILYTLNPDTNCDPDFTICPTKGLGYYCWIISYATLMIGIISDTLFPSPRVIDLFERERIV